MNPAQFNKRISFEQLTETANENGFKGKDWKQVKSVWAMVKTVQGREYFQASQVQAENNVRFIVRYTTGITTDMRIKYKNRNFDIQSIINDDEANKTLTVIGRELVK